MPGLMNWQCRKGRWGLVHTELLLLLAARPPGTGALMEFNSVTCWLKGIQAGQTGNQFVLTREAIGGEVTSFMIRHVRPRRLAASVPSS